jgi:hypothetical protein
MAELRKNRSPERLFPTEAAPAEFYFSLEVELSPENCSGGVLLYTDNEAIESPL